jgi:DNA mismatch endonuclease Vsr
LRAGRRRQNSRRIFGSSRPSCDSLEDPRPRDALRVPDSKGSRRIDRRASVVESRNVRRLPAFTPMFVPPSRSYNMARVRGDMETRLERRLASAFWAAGVRAYRRRCKKHLGRPDFCFHRARVAVFVDGCFWHWCPVHFSLPATRADFWKKKLSDNRSHATTSEASKGP